MKTRKLMLPMMAFICAISMAFASSNFSDPTSDYIDLGTTVMEIDEVNCNSGQRACKVQLEENGTEYQVFDDPGLTTPKNTNSNKPFRLY